MLDGCSTVMNLCSFKRLKGELDEMEGSGWLLRNNRRITLDRGSRERP